MDAIDGKHARNIKASSPMGTLFDHGIDAFTTHFVILGHAHCMSISTFQLLELSMTGYMIFIVSMMDGYYTGTFKT